MRGLLIAVGVLLMVGCEKPPVYKSHHVHVMCPNGDTAKELKLNNEDTISIQVHQDIQRVSMKIETKRNGVITDFYMNSENATKLQLRLASAVAKLKDKKVHPDPDPSQMWIRLDDPIPASDALLSYFYDATTERVELMGWAVPIEDLPPDDSQVELVWTRDGKEHRALFNVMSRPTRFVDKEHTTMLNLNSKRQP